MNETFALIDCNNFFASCERVFRPDLQNTPIAVLSVNDGCIIARSNEAKKLGLPMGAPVYQYQDVINKHKIKLFSANFKLYSDISQRIMAILRQFTPNLEIYSIDEAFLILPQLPSTDLTDYGREIRATILKWTGMPVSIGISNTKTLAKAANEIAKQNPDLGGVLDFTPLTQYEIDQQLAMLPVEEVWGIGFRSATKLKPYGITNTLQFKNASDKWIKQNFKMPGARTQLELRGISCIPLTEIHDPKKGIISSLSFSRPITTLKELKEAVATYATRAAEKLRDENSAASLVYTTLMTNYFKKNERQYYNTHGITLATATAYTPDIIKATHTSLEKIYKPGYSYKKALIALGGITSADHIQENLFSEISYNKKQQELMATVDRVNQKWGSRTIQIASSGLEKLWYAKSSQKSQEYTTDWDQLLTVQL